MYPYWLLVSGLGLVVIWLGYLSFQFWKITGLLEKLFFLGDPSISSGQGFKTTLAEVLKQGKDLEKFKKQNLKNIQRVGLIRYNPYQDTGGNQSFSLVLLNGQGDGLVVSSLHARAGTRVFGKEIKGGKSTNVKLSEEEEKVVEEALK